MSLYLRPDEKASMAGIEKSKSQDSLFKSGAKTAVGLGTSALGLGLASKIMPLLNEFISPELAIKGISKINPEIGKMLKEGMSKGLDIKEGFSFLKNNLSPKEQDSPKEDRNIIQQYSPELFQYMNEEIQRGRSALEAGAIAQETGKFSSAINKMKKDHKTSWGSIIDTVFGKEEVENKRVNTLKKFMEKNKQPSTQERELERFNKYYGQQPQEQEQDQPGNADAELMAMLQKVSQVLKGQ